LHLDQAILITRQSLEFGDLFDSQA
jgi:hypothetical protein